MKLLQWLYVEHNPLVYPKLDEDEVEVKLIQIPSLKALCAKMIVDLGRKKVAC